MPPLVESIPTFRARTAKPFNKRNTRYGLFYFQHLTVFSYYIIFVIVADVIATGQQWNAKRDTKEKNDINGERTEIRNCVCIWAKTYVWRLHKWRETGKTKREREREKNHTSGRSCMLLKKRGTRSIRVIEPTFLRCLSTVVEYDCEQWIRKKWWKNVLFETFIPISLTIRRDKLEFNLFYLMGREIE